MPDIKHPIGKSRIRNHPHQLPSRITDGINNHFPAFSFQILIVHAVFASCGLQAVFTANPIADLNLAGMVNNLPVAVAQVKILSVSSPIDLFHHPLNAGIVHIHQKHAPTGNSMICQLHYPA